MEVWRLKPENIAIMRKNYPKGLRLQFVYSVDPFCFIQEGTQGEVEYVDDDGAIHVLWDTGERSALEFGKDFALDVDELRKLPT